MKLNGDMPVTITLPFDLWLLTFYCLFSVIESGCKLKKMHVFPFPARKPGLEEVTKLSSLLCGILLECVKEVNPDEN